MRKIRTRDFIYKENKVLKDKNIIIIKNYRDEKNRKCVEYKCLKCGYINRSLEPTIKKVKHGCPCCNNKVTVKEINSVWKTRNDLVQYFKNIEDAYTHTKGSDFKAELKCPCCGYEKTLRISKLNQKGFRCPNCNDGMSYPEKFVRGLLNTLGTSFKAQYSPEWSEGKRYDYYLNDFNCIIEVNGLQHYKGGFERKNGRTLEEEQINDQYKKELALKNNINIYIILDCRKSELSWIKQSILNSKLNELFDLTNINWDKIGQFAISNLAQEVCEYKKKFPDSTCKSIGEYFNISKTVVSKYLKQMAT